MKVKPDRVLSYYLFPWAVRDMAMLDGFKSPGYEGVMNPDKLIEKNYGMPIEQIRKEVHRLSRDIMARRHLKFTHPDLVSYASHILEYQEKE